MPQILSAAREFKKNQIQRAKHVPTCVCVCDANIIYARFKLILSRTRQTKYNQEKKREKKKLMAYLFRNPNGKQSRCLFGSFILTINLIVVTS